MSNRQKGRAVATELESMGITLRYANLKAGDFLISGKMAVEIVTADEFLESISSKMLFRRLIDFRRDFPEAVYIIEGFTSMNGKMNSPKVRSAISYITILNHMPVIITRDAKDSAAYLNLFARQAQHGLTFDPEAEKKKVKFTSAREAQLAIAETLPEVGPTTAEALLEKFGSLESLFKASVHDLMQVDGIGKKKAEKIRSFMLNRFKK